MIRPSSVLVIGVGNELRGDDAAGLLVARKIAGMGLSGVLVVERDGEGTELLDLFEGSDCVFLVDAVQAGGAAGKIYRFEAHREALPVNFFHYSTHAFSVAEAVEMARVLGNLPSKLVVFGIEGARFEMGSEVSDEVEEAMVAVAGRLREELNSYQ